MLRPAPPCLLVCVGKDCRRAKGYTALVDAARTVPGAVGVPCQGICDGPVVGVVVKGEVRWLAGIRKGGLRRAAVTAATESALTSDLRARERRSHRGEVDGAKKATSLADGSRVPLR